MRTSALTTLAFGAGALSATIAKRDNLTAVTVKGNGTLNALFDLIFSLLMT